MRCELVLEIRNLHACPGDRNPKELIVEKNRIVKIKTTQTEEEIEEELSFDEGKEKKTEEKRSGIQPLYAFLEEEGLTKVRLGGPYGKLMGLLKVSGSFLYTQKTPGFKAGYKKMLKSMIVKPQWVALEEASGIEIASIPQIMAGRSQAMIIQYYEMIPFSIARISIDMPDTIKGQFETLVKQAEGMPFGPKRRGEISIRSMEWK